jgi:hypothetical protein
VLELPCTGLGFNLNEVLQGEREVTLGRATISMRFELVSEIVGRSDLEVAIMELQQIARNAVPGGGAKQDGGEDGIRTHEKLLTSTPLAGERLRPLGHLSVAPLDKEKRRHNQQAGAIIAEKSTSPRRSLGAMRRFRGDSPECDSGWRPNSGGSAPDSGACEASMVNGSFRTGAKSCHLCNNVRR